MRKHFDKSRAIDAAISSALTTMIKSHSDPYTAEELEILDRGLEKTKKFEQIRSRSVTLPSPLARAKIAIQEGNSKAWGWASTKVRASPEEVLAFVWNTDSKTKQKRDDLEKAVDERPNRHNMVVYVRRASRERSERTRAKQAQEKAFRSRKRRHSARAEKARKRRGRWHSARAREGAQAKRSLALRSRREGTHAKRSLALRSRKRRRLLVRSGTSGTCVAAALLRQERAESRAVRGGPPEPPPLHRFARLPAPPTY
jgi:hypothetical protein